MTISKNGFQTFDTNKIILGDGKMASLSALYQHASMYQLRDNTNMAPIVMNICKFIPMIHEFYFN